MLNQIIEELEETLVKLKAYQQGDAVLPEEGNPSIEDVRTVIKKGLRMGAYEINTVLMILEKYDATRVPSLKESDYANVISDIDTQILLTDNN